MNDKHLSGKQLVVISAVGMVLSLTFHLLTVLNIYLMPNSIILILSIGMLFAWFQSSRQIRIFKEDDDQNNPWRKAWSFCPLWIKYMTYFFALYSLLNFVVSLEPDQTLGYINTSVSQAKLRGISGFWLAFYMFVVSIGYAAIQRDKKSEHENE